MYETFFELRERPFDLAPNPRFLFLTDTQREALGNLRYGLTSPRGLTLLLGEAGTGKTTLVQAVLADLPPGSVEWVLLSNPTLTRDEFYEFLTDAFGLESYAGSKTRFLFALRRRLDEGLPEGRLTALVLDEAQSLPHELLEEVRLLSNIEIPGRKLLNVVLAGQPELADRLNEPGLRQLKQRISLRCELRAFTLHETAAYIAGRLRIAGGKPAEIFSREAIAVIHEVSRGVPRMVNVICDNALIGGYAAQAKPLTRAILQEVIRDFDLRPAAAAGPDAEPRAEGIPPAATLPVRSDPAENPGGPPGGREGAAMFDLYERRRKFSFF